MAVQHVQALDAALHGRDVCAAWAIWSSAAEGALADAFQLPGGRLPSGLVGGRGAARFRTVRLGGPRVRRARCDLIDCCVGVLP